MNVYVEIPEHDGTDPSHVSTSLWVLSNASDDKEDSIWRKENVTDSKELIPIPVTKLSYGNVYYVLIELNMSDSSVVKYDVITLDTSDYKVEFNGNVTQKVGKVIPTNIVNDVSDGGDLKFTLSIADGVKPERVNVSLTNGRNQGCYCKTINFIDGDSVTIQFDELYVKALSGGYVLTLIGFDSTGRASDPVTTRMDDSNSKYIITSNITRLDPKEPIVITYDKDGDDDVISAKVFESGKRIESVSADNDSVVINGDGTYKYDTIYKVVLETDDDGEADHKTIFVSTMSSRNIRFYRPAYAYADKLTRVKQVRGATVTYGEKLSTGVTLAWENDKYIKYGSLSTIENRTRLHQFDIDVSKPIYQTTLTSTLASLVYTNSDGVKYITVFQYNTIGDIEYVVRVDELDDSMSGIPLPTVDTKDGSLVVLVIKMEDDIYYLHDLVTATNLKVVKGIDGLSNMYLTKLESQRVLILGNSRSVHIYDFNSDALDLVNTMPSDIRDVPLITTLGCNGNALLFKVDTDTMFEYSVVRDKFIEHTTGSIANGILRSRDCSVYIQRKVVADDGYPNTTNILRYT